MNRLQSELHRLYGASSPDQIRAMTMELSYPADWVVLSKVWRGVQADLQLPAPAIAVSGTDGLQLWFSLQDPVGAPRAAAFLAQLRARYLAGIAPARLRLNPSATEPFCAVPPVPQHQASTGHWSAFVAPDLAPVFADTPWLDIQPGDDGQADLLARLESIRPAALDAAMQSLAPVVPDSESSGLSGAPLPGTGADLRLREPAGDAPAVDPTRFLQQVLNDETLPLALRIEAAKALLRAGHQIHPAAPGGRD